MKNIFSKSNAPYIVGVTVATIALVASGVFALAPYVAFLAPVAALGVGLPFVIGGAVLSVVTGVLSAVAIGKNSTISQQEKFENLADARKIALPKTPRQEKFENLVAARKKEEANERAELKLPDVIALPYKLGSVPNVIALPYKNAEAPIQSNQPDEEKQSQGWFNRSIDMVKSVGSKVNTVVREYAPYTAPTLLTAATIFLASSLGTEKGESGFGYNNGTQCFPYQR